ncbi:MAG: hypothetical protein QJR13_07480, partial [Bacillota bacterium]|nr:hypothetical protein [Bacillota bacterium]
MAGGGRGRERLMHLAAVVVLACAFVWAVWPSRAEAGFSVSVTLTARDEDAAQALFIGAMAGFFGVDSSVVLRYQERERDFLETISV